MWNSVGKLLLSLFVKQPSTAGFKIEPVWLAGTCRGRQISLDVVRGLSCMHHQGFVHQVGAPHKHPCADQAFATNLTDCVPTASHMCCDFVWKPWQACKALHAKELDSLFHTTVYPHASTLAPSSCTHLLAHVHAHAHTHAYDMHARMACAGPEVQEHTNSKGLDSQGVRYGPVWPCSSQS